MFPPSPDQALSHRRIALLNHRGEALEAFAAWFQDQGWQIRSTDSLDESAQLLCEKHFQAVAIAPVTLGPETLEWQKLLPLLSPHVDLPWLILPWQDARPSRVGNLLQGHGALADWLPAPFSGSEAEARVLNLLRLQELLNASRQRSEALAAQLIIDHKTELANDRHFRSRLAEEFARSQRHQAAFTVMLIDIDDFKQINDQTSYEFGDTVLRSIAEVIRQSVRNIDIPARIGGDEFAVLMPNTNLEEGVGVANRILASIDGLVVREMNTHAEVRLSIGTATYEGQGLTEATQVFLQANEALKAAKSAGKNRVYFYDPMHGRPAG
jgi:diguanylate cyclase (GGDEF)-like protein